MFRNASANEILRSLRIVQKILSGKGFVRIQFSRDRREVMFQASSRMKFLTDGAVAGCGKLEKKKKNPGLSRASGNVTLLALRFSSLIRTMHLLPDS